MFDQVSQLTMFNVEMLESFGYCRHSSLGFTVITLLKNHKAVNKSKQSKDLLYLWKFSISNIKLGNVRFEICSTYWCYSGSLLIKSRGYDIHLCFLPVISEESESFTERKTGVTYTRKLSLFTSYDWFTFTVTNSMPS